jgi:hypothetical protein
MKSVPAGDISCKLALKSKRGNLTLLGVVGDTYTIILIGDGTAGRFCLMDWHVPPGGGPPVCSRCPAVFSGERHSVD